MYKLKSVKVCIGPCSPELVGPVVLGLAYIMVKCLSGAAMQIVVATTKEKESGKVRSFSRASPSTAYASFLLLLLLFLLPLPSSLLPPPPCLICFVLFLVFVKGLST